MWRVFLLVMIVLIAVLAGCSPRAEVPSEKVSATGAVEKPEQEAKVETPPVEETAVDESEIKTTPEGVKYLVDPAKIIGGGPPKDGIPSIDRPSYVSLEEADHWIQDDELVLTIIYKGVTRVYPLQIMVWHEIVNDTIAGDPILITY